MFVTLGNIIIDFLKSKLFFGKKQILLPISKHTSLRKATRRLMFIGEYVVDSSGVVA